MTVQPQSSRSDEADGALATFLAEMIADEYPAAVPAEEGKPTSLRVVAAVVAGLIGLVIAVSLLNARFSIDERQQTRAELMDRVASGTAAVDDRQASVDALAAQVDALRQQMLSAQGGDEQTAADLERLSAAAGVGELSGPGVKITIDDAPDASSGSLNRVLDRDLQDIVNALWRAGATGIAINGQRLTSASAIRAAGDAILVDYQPLNRPYTVSAVGASESSIRAAGLPSLLGALGTDYGLVSDTSAGDVALPAGDVRELRFATTTSAPPNAQE